MSSAVVLRRSALEAFACPFRYHKLYVERVPDDSDEARRGRAFHAAAHRYITGLWAARQTEDLRLAERALVEGLEVERTPTHLVPEVVDLWWKWAPDFELDLDAYLGAEARQVDAAGYSWTPDLLYARGDTLEAPDFKTYYLAFDAEQARRELQARFYAASARRLYPGFTYYRVTFVFVRWGVSASATFEAADLDAIEFEIDVTARNILRAAERNDWPAVPGAHCSFCRLACPVVNDARLLPVRINDQADAERTAAQLLVLDRAVDARRAALAGWCAEHGPVTVGGMEFAHRPANRVTFPIDQVLRVFEEQGITPQFDVSKSTLRRYLTTKRFAHVRPDLEALAQIKPATRFGARKVGATLEELPAGSEVDAE